VIVPTERMTWLASGPTGQELTAADEGAEDDDEGAADVEPELDDPEALTMTPPMTPPITRAKTPGVSQAPCCRGGDNERVTVRTMTAQKPLAIEGEDQDK
jgi:hypothetical protein